MSPNELMEAFRDAQPGYLAVPYHLVGRAHFLLGAEDPVFVDIAMKDNNDLLFGSAVVLTETRVIDARIKGTPKNLERRIEHGPTIHVASWNRSRLERIAIHRGDEAETNDDFDWSRDYSGQWPALAQLSLHYGSGLDELRLPLSPRDNRSQREAFASLVPSLIADLG